MPDGNRLAFHYDAVGVQIYACRAAATRLRLGVHRAPKRRSTVSLVASPARTTPGRRGKSKDGSKVVGSKLAAFTADPTAIPELLLTAVSHEGNGRMTKVTYVQRLDTVGGLAPADGCDTAHVGAVARSDYTATYYFYKPAFHFVCDSED